VLLIAVASILVLVAGTLGLAALKPDITLLALGLSALEAIALTGSVYILGLRRRGFTWEAVGLRPIRRGWAPVAVSLGVLCIWLTGIIATLVQRLLGLPLENPQLQFIAPGGLNWVGAVGMFVVIGLAVPFAEELFFRGVLYVWLRDRWGFAVGAIVSAVIFGAAHGNVAIAAGVGVMGLIQAWVYERSGSLWATVLIHAINNAVKIVLVYALLAAGVKLS
jgi:membrane protease YdiL (CAAX protease family)